MVRNVVLLVAMAAVAWSGCDDQRASGPEPTNSHPAAGESPSVSEGLTFTNGRNATYEMHDADVTCQPSQHDDRTEVVNLTTPAGYQKRFRHGRIPDPFFWVEVVPGGVGEYDLPLTGGSVETVPDVVVFGVDSEDQNELSGSVETATGVVTILEATCDPEPRLAFTIRATLGSEIGLAGVHAVGG